MLEDLKKISLWTNCRPFHKSPTSSPFDI